MTIMTIGLDIAKNVFQIHGADGNGKTVLRKQVEPDKLLVLFANMTPCLIGVEACSGAHYWAFIFLKCGSCTTSALHKALCR